MVSHSRTYNAVNNTFYGIIASAVTVVLNLLVRVIIVDYLGEQINGLHSLFISTINVLSLVQMGFSTAMVIHLYQPVHEKDELKICQLINYYKKIYHHVAWVFLVLGLLVCFFLMNYLVTTTINMWLVRGYFLLFILSYFVNYRTYYKRSLLFAEQKNRISVLATAVSEVTFRGIAILLVVFFKQYYIFLFMMICDCWFSNLLCARYVDKHHPYVVKYKDVTLPLESQKAVKKTIKPLMVNQISDTVQKSSQSILISILLGNVAIVGYYGSYQLISSTIQLLMSQIGGAFTSGFGNLSAEHNELQMSKTFLKFFFAVGYISILLCTISFCCIQDIILFLFGQDFVLPTPIVLMITVMLFLTIIGIPTISVQNALGLHKLDSKWMVIQAVFAVLFGYIGGKYWGMNGIIIGQLIPLIIFTIIGKGLIITKYVFKKYNVHYSRNLVLLLTRAIIVAVPTYLICASISFDSILLNACVKAAAAFFISCIFLCIVYLPNQFLVEYFNVIKKKIWKCT